MSQEKSVDDIYRKLKHKDHILQLPDTYIGSIEKHNEFLYTLDESGESPKIVKKYVEYVPGLLNIFNEILVNSTDHATRLEMMVKNKKKSKSKKQPDIALMTEIRVSIDKQSGEISIYNNGDGIDAEILKEHDMYPVQLIFGELLTSTNYDKTEQKVIGGKNGYGAKLTNIFSTSFKVESVDRKRQRVVTAEYRNNMSDEEKIPVIMEPYEQEPYTRITFTPDYSKFDLEGLTDDIYYLMKKRIYDVAAWTDKSISVYLNDELIPYSTFKDYVAMYLGDNENYPRIHQKINDRWEIVATVNSDEKFEHVSFVNGINTYRGGKHVSYIADQIKRQMTELIKKKNKVTIRPQYVVDQLLVFVKCQIVNPAFDSQTKETLNTNIKKFGSTCEIDKKFIERLANETDLVERVLTQNEYKNNKSLKKTDGKKRMRIKVPKLDDANWAGGRKSKQCTLILTEGDSAKSMAISGLSVIGRDKYGVFPLRGKVLNVKNADFDKIANNKELCNLKKILGLQNEKEYDKDSKEWPLRYGKIMIMTDQDVDGSHIKGLLFNMFQVMWPSLIKSDFITSLITPIIKVSKGKSTESFYTLTDYYNWKKSHRNGKGWKIKYYKGLGTSTSKEAKEYFRELKLVNYKWSNVNCDDSIDLAFNKDKADNRKDWLQKYDSETILDSNDSEVTYNDFIHKEFIHFSNEDLKRSVPCLCDGLKPSQRKVLYSAFKRNLKKEIKVAQLSGYVSEHAAYHHGEVSLQATIVNMAQDFLGSNNLNLLQPNGQFGTRIMGGKDSASPRYIFTVMSQLTPLIYPASDFPLLEYLNDDGFEIEPKYYIPIIPMILINGGKGIGTGYSTDIPNYNPVDVIRVLKMMMRGESVDDQHLVPYYRGFKGRIQEKPKGGYITKGSYKFTSISQMEVTELPIGVWTDNYKEYLESILIDTYKSTSKKKKNGKEKKSPRRDKGVTVTSKQFIKSFENYSTETDVRFVLKMKPTILNQLKNKTHKDTNMTYLEKRLGLTSMKNITNMHLYNERDQICKFTNVVDIIKYFYKLRLDLYVKRKNYMEAQLQKELDVLEAKVRFITDFIEGNVELRNKKKTEIFEQFKTLNYPKFDLLHKKGETGYKLSYDYLIRMQLYSLTKEKVDELVALRDAKRQELDALIEKTAINLWEEDLAAFEKQYYKVYPDSKKLKKTKSPKSKKTTKNKVIKVLKGSNKTDIKPVLKTKAKKFKIKKKIVISPTNKE